MPNSSLLSDDPVTEPDTGSRDPSRAPSVPDARRDLRSAALLTALIAGFGIGARWEAIVSGVSRPGERNIFIVLFTRHELPFLVLLGAFAVGTITLLWFQPAGRASSTGGAELPAPDGRGSLLLAVAIAAATFAITHLVLHGLLFSMDEFSVDFEARLLARGRISTVVPWPWRSLSLAITPIFVGFDPETGRWLSQYLPVYALLKAPFVALGVPTLLNPVLTALSVVVLARIARGIWPDERLRPWVAIALFATSSEILVTAGTGYSMPGHLLFNLIWLRLYQRGDGRSWIAALLIGALALGLHNPFPHALFVAPFLLRLAREGRWRRAVSAGLVYGASSAAWFAWLRFVYPAAKDQGGLSTLFAIPGVFAAWLHGVNLALLFTWQAPVFAILVLLALSRPRRLPPILVDSALGVAFTFGFFVFFASTQGHGWGYRYLYQVLGSLCLLGAAAMPGVETALGERTARRWLIAGLVITVVGQIPARLMQTEQFVRPFALAHEYLQTRKARVLLVDGEHVWYGRDLFRNDPFLRSPIIVRFSKLAPGSPEAIERAYPGRVIRVRDEDLLAFGLIPRDPHRVLMTPP
jgi:hypothetical protein